MLQKPKQLPGKYNKYVIMLIIQIIKFKFQYVPLPLQSNLQSTAEKPVNVPCLSLRFPLLFNCSVFPATQPFNPFSGCRKNDCFSYYSRNIHYLTREFHLKSHAKNRRCHRNREAMSALSVHA